MGTTLRIVHAGILLVIIAFIIAVVVGVFTAFNAAPAYTLSTSGQSVYVQHAL